MAYGTSAQAATPLQAARLEMGWKQAQTIRALQQAAHDQGVTIASERSLKTMLSRWENGHDKPDALGKRLLCSVYGASPEELGLAGKESAVPLVPALSPAVGPDMAQYFRNVFIEHLRADNLMGPHHLVDVVRAQATLLDQMLPNARGAVRDQLLMLAFRYNEFTGWLYQDAGNTDLAMRYTDRSMEYALEMGEARETSYVLMRKADIAADLDNPERVIGLSQAAMRDSSRVPARARALILRLRGRAYAQLGDTGECARALDAAQTEVLSSDAEPDGLTDYCTPSYIGMEAAISWTRLGRFDVAVSTFERSLPSWPAALRRDQGLCLARLANAYAGQGNTEKACEAGRQAVDVIRAATSSRALSELQRVRVRLAPLRKHAEVSDLSDRIRNLFKPVA
jgi:hypothetical protein